jgi:hypothetical protein
MVLKISKKLKIFQKIYKSIKKINKKKNDTTFTTRERMG